MLKINLQRHGFTQQSLPAAQWNMWAGETLLRKPSCESLALQTKAQCKDPRPGGRGLVKEQLHGPKTSPQDFPCHPQGIFNLEAPPAGKPQATETSYLKGLLESSMEWISFGFEAHLGVNLRGLFYGLKEEAAKNYRITVMTVGAERRTQGLA